jgi:hypothetical protein
MFKVAMYLLFFSSLSTAAKFDPPDLALEDQIHRQYLNSQNPRPILESSEGWLENYSLQQGESLWSLSQLLYGDRTYWPKVWAQNQTIPNPPLIRKGHTLQFLMGSVDEAPAFRFSEGEDSGLELAAASGSSSPQVELPPPEVTPRAVIRVPPSFPEWQTVYKQPLGAIQGGAIDMAHSHMSVDAKLVAGRVQIAAFVQELPVDSAGQFLEAEKESGLPVVNQYVYVKLKKGTGRIGAKYLVVNDLGNVRKLNEQVEGEIKAHFIQIYSEVQISDHANGKLSKSDAEKYDVFRALITHTTHLTISGSDLIPGQLETVQLNPSGPSAPTTAQVIGSFKLDSSALYGIGDIVFLNKGSNNGLQPGQIMDLYIDRSIRDEGTKVFFSNISSGTLQVVKVSTTCATGVILKAIDSIQQGDRAQPHLAAGQAPPPEGTGDELELDQEKPSSDDPGLANPESDLDSSLSE